MSLIAPYELRPCPSSQARHRSAGVIDGEMWTPDKASRIKAELRAEEVPHALAMLWAEKELCQIPVVSIFEHLAPGLEKMLM